MKTPVLGSHNPPSCPSRRAVLAVCSRAEGQILPTQWWGHIAGKLLRGRGHPAQHLNTHTTYHIPRHTRKTHQPTHHIHPYCFGTSTHPFIPTTKCTHMRPHRTHTSAQAPYPTHITPPRVATVRHLQISSHARDTQKYPFTHTHAQPTHTQGATPSHTCSQAHITQRMTLRRAHFPAWSVLALIYIGPHNRLYPTFLPQARTPGAHLCSASPTRQPAPARGFPLGVQRPQWPGIKMQRGGAGRVSTASPGAHSARRRRPARPEPWGQRAEEQVL